MPTARSFPSRRLWWSVAVGAVLVVAVLVVVAVVSSRGGQKTERGAVAEYVKAVNAGDLKALAKDLHPGGAVQARKAIAASAKQPIVITGINVQHQFEPDVATASLHGTAGGQPLDLVLPLIRSGGRWYIATVVPSSPGEGPTAVVSQP